MEKKKISRWFLLTAGVALIGFIIPNIARSMFRSGILPKGIITTIVDLSTPIALLAGMAAFFLLIYLVVKK